MRKVELRRLNKSEASLHMPDISPPLFSTLHSAHSITFRINILIITISLFKMYLWQKTIKLCFVSNYKQCQTNIYSIWWLCEIPVSSIHPRELFFFPNYSQAICRTFSNIISSGKQHFTLIIFGLSQLLVTKYKIDLLSRN